MAFLDNKAVGERLKTYREKKKLSARQFSAAMDVDSSQYNKIENGDLPMTKKIMDKALKKYPDLDREYILHGKITPHVEQNGMLSEELGKMHEQLLFLNASNDVLLQSVVNLISNSTGKSAALVSGELQEAVSMTVKQRLGELKKKRG